jgi:hypothetical protein
MAEFASYFGGKLAASPAHLYGKPVVSVEAFTASPLQGSDWRNAFSDLKPWADYFFCGGINHFTYHVYTAQAFSDAVKPGLTLAGWGSHFNRGQTWWPEVSAFSTYLARSSYLLQQGRFVADVLFFCGEGSPKNKYFNAAHPDAAYKLPKGYDCDIGDLDVLLNRITVKDGQLVTPDGITYKLLVIPNESDAMTPQLVKRIGELVDAGATVMAPKPKLSPSLRAQPRADANIKQLAEKIWGKCDGVQAKEHEFGEGKILWGRTLEDTLHHLQIPPAVESPMIRGYQGEDHFVLRISDQFEGCGWTQRRLPHGDLFFVMNRGDQNEKADFTFRTEGTSPQWFDPVSGTTRMLPEFEKADGRVKLNLEFAPHQSGFVFFAYKAKPVSGKNNPQLESVQTLEGSWNVRFDPKWGPFDSAFSSAKAAKDMQARLPGEFVFETLEDWSKSANEAIKYYSGRATYTKSFTMPTVESGRKYFLDLGTVKNLANVTLNGKKLGTVWCAPWHIEIEPNSGRNVVQIEVINLWVNRLIGDEKFDGSVAYDAGGHSHFLPEWLNGSVPRPEKRYTYSLFNPWKADSPLQPSGLLGPVSIRVVD